MRALLLNTLILGLTDSSIGLYSMPNQYLLNQEHCFDSIVSEQFFPLLCFDPPQHPYEQQTSVSVPQYGQSFGYNHAHFQPGHGQQAVMMRQKSIGNTNCYGTLSAL